MAYRIAMLLTLPVLAMDTVGIPLISAKFQEDDRPGAQKLGGDALCRQLRAGGNRRRMLYFLGPLHPLHVRSRLRSAAFRRAGALVAGGDQPRLFGPGTWLTMIGGGESHLLRMRSLVFILYAGLLYVLGVSLVSTALPSPAGRSW
ncbi:MAG: hypothetical protein HPM95_04910 [Alphaproteobacteria bacterium]|nr:hypothetical protein [Alphaproteobacteria bacterium]